MINYFLLGLTISLSACRNMFSKEISKTAFGSRMFFVLQAVVFLSGAVILITFAKKEMPSVTTVYLALIYALLLMVAQWCYTVALSKINLSICSTIYSFGFIIPTLSGTIFFNEKFSVCDLLGMCAVITAIIASGRTKNDNGEGNEVSRYIVVLVTAMFASGGLGLMQKIQQTLPYAGEKDMFVIVAFMIAAFVSFVLSAFAKPIQLNADKYPILYGILTGICFGACNLLNVILAGRLDSSLFFPIQNIGVILLSTILGCFLSKEKPTKKSAAVFVLGAISIVLLSL